MSRLPLLLLALLAFAVGAAPAHASRPPIVRPVDERGMSDQELGAQLFAGNCASCHGARGQGIPLGKAKQSTSGLTGAGPRLQGVGALAADFYLRTGYMPLGHPGEQPSRARPYFTDGEIRALTKYVASLGKGPPVPQPRWQDADVGEGFKLFTEHCAGCHQVVAEGGVVTGAKVPQLDEATPTQIAEAVRIGPYLMPKFRPSQISDEDLNKIIAYVQYAKNPHDAGGWAINHLGPFPEGLVTWLMATVVLVLCCVLIVKGAKS